MNRLARAQKAIAQRLSGDPQTDQVVPSTGSTAHLTLLSAASMAFLAVFALALSLATGRLAERWEAELSQSITVRISAHTGKNAAQTEIAMRVLETTPGIASVRVIDATEQRAMLAPLLGPELPIDDLPIPQLIDVIAESDGFDIEGLRLRLSGEAPGAVLDDHSRWRAPLIRAAERLRTLGMISTLLIALTAGAMMTLAANAALSANSRVIRVLRLVGATDAYIARAFVHRFTLRAFWGALAGVVIGLIAFQFLPSAQEPENFLTGLGFRGWHWFSPLVIPPVAAIVAFAATQLAAMRILKETP